MARADDASDERFGEPVDDDQGILTDNFVANIPEYIRTLIVG
ncbi:MAG: hypothetical protein AAF479_09390 [Pseudomonadota bacterium]